MRKRHVGISVHDVYIRYLLISLHKVNFHWVDERRTLQTLAASNMVISFDLQNSAYMF